MYLSVLLDSGGHHGHRLKDLLGGLTVAKLFDFQYAHIPDQFMDFFAFGDDRPVCDEAEMPGYRISVKGPAWDGLALEEAKKLQI